MKFYAKVNNPDDIRIDDDSLGSAVCEDEQIKVYGGIFTYLFASLNAVISPWIITLSLVMVCSIRSKISCAMDKEQNHASLAALALTGLVFSTLVLVPDVWALVLVYQGKQEFPNKSQVDLLYVVLVFDALGALVSLGALGALSPLGTLCCLGCHRLSPKQCQNQTSFRVKLSLGAMCFAPIFFVASHSGYIIIAHVSDTQHAGPATFWYIISFFYIFVSFRQLYDLCGKLVTKLCKVSSISKLRASLAAKCTCCQSTSETTTFNLSAFFIEVLLAIPLVGAEVFVVYVLVALPATLTAVSTDIYHLAQWAFVITTGLIAYKFIYTENKYKRYNIHHPEVHNSIRNTAFGYLTS